MDYFNSFWSIYPRKVAKVDAEKAATKIKSDQWAIIMEAIQKHIKYWKQHGTQKIHIPYPASWLNGKRWLDEIEEEVVAQTESTSYIFIKAVRNKNNLTLPDLPHDIKQAFFRMKIPWGKLQTMHESELEEKFSAAYNNVQPEREIDFKSKAAGE